MQGMRHRRRNLCIAACGCEAFCSNGWVIITVDEVVGDTGMPRLLRKDLFEDCCRLQSWFAYVLSVGGVVLRRARA
jgi:hypothetical protein